MSLYYLLALLAFLLYLQGAVYFIIFRKNARADRLYLLGLLSFCWFSFFLIFMYTGGGDANRLYQLDRLASVGWTSFPVLLTWFFALFTKENNPKIIWVLKYVLSPLSVLLFFRYMIDPQSLKSFYYVNQVLHFSTSAQSPWFYVFSFYIAGSSLLSGSIILRWRIKRLHTNKERLQWLVLFSTLLVSVVFSMLTNIAMPVFGSPALPGLAHVNFLPLMGGIFYLLVSRQTQPFSPDMALEVMNDKVGEIVLLIDETGSVLFANKQAASQLGIVPEKPGSELIFSFIREDALLKVCSPKQGKPLFEAWHGQRTLIGRSDQLSWPVKLSVMPVNDPLFAFSGWMICGESVAELMPLENRLSEILKENSYLNDGIRNLQSRLKGQEKEVHDKLTILEALKPEPDHIKAQIKAGERQMQHMVSEVHHRVKNNIQIVISLINQVVSTPGILLHERELISELTDRIRKLAEMLDHFYLSDSLSGIDLDAFFHQQCRQWQSNVKNGDRIRVRFALNGGRVPLKLGLLLGLIQDEILINSFMYPEISIDEEEGNSVKHVVVIKTHRQGKHFSYEIYDNAIRRHETHNRQRDSISRGLVRLLANDFLHASLHRDDAFGLHTRIDFELNQEKNPF